MMAVMEIFVFTYSLFTLRGAEISVTLIALALGADGSDPEIN